MSSTIHAQTTDFLTVTGNTAHTKPENRAFFPALDGLRALAFLMVFGHHYLQIPWGWTGVDLFFVLSGFLITGILFDSRNDSYRIRNFYIRRTLRIFPLYYGIMLGIVLIGPVLHWQINWHWLAWPAYLGNYLRFVQPYVDLSPLQRLADFQPIGHFGHKQLWLFLGHFWSLCVEEQFYLLWPWVVFWVRDRRKLFWICMATLPLCLAMRLTGQHVMPHWMLENEILYRATPFRFDALLLGGLMALILRGRRKEVLLRASHIALPIALGLVLLWVVFSPQGHIWQEHYRYPDWKFTWGLSAVDILSGLLILVAIQPGSFVYRAFSLRPLRWIGRISYGAYVLHDIPHLVYKSVSEKLIWRFDSGRQIGEHTMQQQAVVLAAVIALATTLALSWMSFRYYESFFLNLKERWTVREGR